MASNRVLSEAGFQGRLTLGSIFNEAGIDPSEVLLVRHTFKKDGLTGPDDLSSAKIMAYVREQGVKAYKFPKSPPRIWLNFVADGGNRGRFLMAFENQGESLAERTEELRFYNLAASDCLASFQNRMVIEWAGHTINWAKWGEVISGFHVAEIADAQAEPFPGFDNLLLSYRELQSVMENPRFAIWREVLKSVQGIYLISDTSTGQLYVGKADGSERILGRWGQYAKTGHGGNVALRDLDTLDISHRNHFQFSILRVFSPGASASDVDAAESHYKKALLSRQFGMNRN